MASNMSGGLDEMMSRSSGTGVPYLKFEKDARRLLRFLQPWSEGKGMISHSIRVGNQFKGTQICLGTPECPGCQAGDKGGFRGLIWAWDVKEKKLGIFGGGKRAMQALQKVHEAYNVPEFKPPDICFRPCWVAKSGEGTQTTFMIDPAILRPEKSAIADALKLEDDYTDVQLSWAGPQYVKPLPFTEADVAEIVKAVSEVCRVKISGAKPETLIEVLRDPLRAKLVEQVQAPTLEEANRMWISSGAREGAVSDSVGGNDFELT